MIDEGVHETLAATPPSAFVAMIATLVGSPDRSEIASLSDIAERRRRLDIFYALAKAPYLEAVAELRGVKVVDPLLGTGQFILEARGATWKRVLAAQESVFRREGLEIRANRVCATL